MTEISDFRKTRGKKARKASLVQNNMQAIFEGHTGRVSRHRLVVSQRCFLWGSGPVPARVPGLLIHPVRPSRVSATLHRDSATANTAARGLCTVWLLALLVSNGVSTGSPMEHLQDPREVSEVSDLSATFPSPRERQQFREVSLKGRKPSATR